MKGPHCADIYLQAMRFCLPNTSELVKHKFWDCIQAGGCGDGPHLSCMNSAGLEPTTMTISIGSKPSSGKEFLRNR
jgi:hypothetical protein